MFFLALGRKCGLKSPGKKITGKRYKESVGILSAILVFIGFNITFFPQFFIGLRGLPRRYYDYPAAFQHLNVISTIGSYVLAVGFLIALVALLHGVMRGKPAPANPTAPGSHINTARQCKRDMK